MHREEGAEVTGEVQDHQSIRRRGAASPTPGTQQGAQHSYRSQFPAARRPQATADAAGVPPVETRQQSLLGEGGGGRGRDGSDRRAGGSDGVGGSGGGSDDGRGSGGIDREQQEEGVLDLAEPRLAHPGRDQDLQAGQQQENQDRLVLLYMNARSILSKIDHLNILVKDEKPHVVLINESWLNDSISNSLISIDGYYIDNELRIDKNVNHGRGIGGGLLVYVRNDVIVQPDNYDFNTLDFTQYCRFKVFDKAHKNPLNFTLVYRSPNSSVENNFKLARVMENSKKNSFFIGDVNYPRLKNLFPDCESPCNDINKDDIAFAARSKSGQLLVNAAENSFNTQIVDFPTHIKGNLLDVVYTDIPGSVISCEDIGNLSNSDHSIIKLVIDFAPKSTASSELIRDWRRGDKESLAIHISEIDFPSLFQGKNVDEAWETLKGSLNQALDRYIQLIERRKKGDPPWMMQSVKRLVQKKQRNGDYLLKIAPILILWILKVPKGK